MSKTFLLAIYWHSEIIQIKWLLKIYQNDQFRSSRPAGDQATWQATLYHTIQ